MASSRDNACVGKSIDDYRSKRDFGETPEPAPGKPGKRHGPPVFVVHRHEASRLHYDLRLEFEGALCSWAVPKGFSFDPTVKHLAVRTEDHPIEYEDFDGIIPAGQYGAGSMTIWDKGTYELVVEPDWEKSMAKGEVKLLLHGRRLRGEWHMVKTMQAEDSWLLFKSKDAYSGPARDSALGVDLSNAIQTELPRRISRMEPAESAAPFSDPGWLFEMEFAGKRVFAEKRGADVSFRGVTRSLPGLEKEVREWHAENALVEGVIVVLDDKERPSKPLLDAHLAGKSEARLWFYAFDLLYYDEFDLRPLALIQRKTGLRAVLGEAGSVLYLDHVSGEGEELVAAVAGAGLTGVIAKRADAPYSAGETSDWKRVHADVDDTALALEVSEAIARTSHAPRKSRVKFTNLDKIYWPAESFTKGDLIAWYECAAEYLLPYLKERPVHMNRFPDGIEGKSFYQRQRNVAVPDWIETELIQSNSKEEALPQIICNSRDSLLCLANLGSIDLHPWLSRRGTLDSPDFVVIDLDPKEAPFFDVVKIARITGRLLRGVGLRPLLKTSGSTGLHIYVPLSPGYTYDQSRMFCEGVARIVCRELPDIATVERAISSRGRKVYVDYGQNRRGQTVVPPYVVRPVPGATVSAPLFWDELDSKLRMSQFTMQSMPARLEEHGDLFRDALTDPQDLLPAIEKLQEHLTRD